MPIAGWRPGPENRADTFCFNALQTHLRGVLAPTLLGGLGGGLFCRVSRRFQAQACRNGILAERLHCGERKLGARLRAEMG